ncbi:tetratricopeptide repeat protein [Shewanella sp. 10N.261.52.F9]|uniref:tetratricopeptide repeat protein n=1 Tax=Shewanella sp. 10N.261.52.F9 TaxID=3229684 RepID=UPI0035513AC1
MLTFIEKLAKKPQQLILIIILIAAGVAVVLFNQSSSKQTKLSDGAIIVLPIQQTIESKQLNWQAYTRMEQVINQLGTSANYPVLLAEDVITELSQSSSFIDDKQTIDLNRLFVISGASLLVEASISTTPSLQLNYRLITHKKTNEGVLKGDSIEVLQSQLVSQIKQFSGGHFRKTTNRNWFTATLVQALKEIQNNQKAKAVASLQQVLNDDTGNLIASRLMAKIEFENKQLKQAANRIEQTITQADTDNVRQIARLKFIDAQIKLDDKELELSLSLLSQARTLAAKSQDWLYLGYISNWAGYIYQRLNHYDKARNQYQLAFDYLKKSGSPAGQVVALNNLAELELLEYNYRLAYDAVNQSVAIVNQRELTQLQQETFALLSKIENKR